MIRTCIAAAALLLLAPSGRAQAAPETATIQVNARHVENHVSPQMYAAFTEMMAEDIKRGLTAEMLLDRSFEQPADSLHLPAHWRLEPDERNDNVGAILFSQTTEAAYPMVDQATHVPNHSLRVTLHAEDITASRTGFSQGRLSIHAGQANTGYFWAKVPAQNGYTAPVRVALEQDVTDGQTYAETTVSGLSGDWRKYTFTLTPSQTDRFAKLSFLFDGVGTVYLDQLSLEPASAVGQVRADSEAKIAALHPSFIRWPGGNVAQAYHWQWGIGPRDLRPVWINTSWSNAPEPDDFGTDEYLAFCQRLHIEPSITVNVGGDGATPEEAAAWVEYVNGPASSKYGAMRAANGHPAPYRVQQWELGNEIFGGWVRGHVSAQQYAEEAVRYAQAMRAIDPSIRLIAVGEGIFPNPDAWNIPVLQTAGPDIQFLAVHDYPSASEDAKAAHPRDAMMAHPAQFEANYRHMGEFIQQNAPGRGIQLIVNEWNLFYSSAVIQSMEGAVYASRMMNGFERDGAIVHANAISDLLNGWVGGILQASRDRIYGTSEYYAIEMYSHHLGTDRLETTLSSPQLEPGENAVDAVATRSNDGSKLYIKLSNAEQSQAVPTQIDVTGFRSASTAELVLLQASTPGERNSFSNPDALHPVESQVECKAGCTLTMPPDSVAVLTLTKR